MKGSQLTQTGGEVDMVPPGKGKNNSKKKKIKKSDELVSTANAGFCVLKLTQTRWFWLIPCEEPCWCPWRAGHLAKIPTH